MKAATATLPVIRESNLNEITPEEKAAMRVDLRALKSYREALHLALQNDQWRSATEGVNLSLKHFFDACSNVIASASYTEVQKSYFISVLTSYLVRIIAQHTEEAGLYVMKAVADQGFSLPQGGYKAIYTLCVYRNLSREPSSLYALVTQKVNKENKEKLSKLLMKLIRDHETPIKESVNLMTMAQGLLAEGADPNYRDSEHSVLYYALKNHADQQVALTLLKTEITSKTLGESVIYQDVPGKGVVLVDNKMPGLSQSNLLMAACIREYAYVLVKALLEKGFVVKEEHFMDAESLTLDVQQDREQTNQLLAEYLSRYSVQAPAEVVNSNESQEATLEINSSISHIDWSEVKEKPLRAIVNKMLAEEPFSTYSHKVLSNALSAILDVESLYYETENYPLSIQFIQKLKSSHHEAVLVTPGDDNQIPYAHCHNYPSSKNCLKLAMLTTAPYMQCFMVNKKDVPYGFWADMFDFLFYLDQFVAENPPKILQDIFSHVYHDEYRIDRLTYIKDSAEALDTLKYVMLPGVRHAISILRRIGNRFKTAASFDAHMTEFRLYLTHNRDLHPKWIHDLSKNLMAQRKEEACLDPATGQTVKAKDNHPKTYFLHTLTSRFLPKRGSPPSLDMVRLESGHIEPLFGANSLFKKMRDMIIRAEFEVVLQFSTLEPGTVGVERLWSSLRDLSDQVVSSQKKLMNIYILCDQKAGFAKLVESGAAPKLFTPELLAALPTRYPGLSIQVADYRHQGLGASHANLIVVDKLKSLIFSASLSSFHDDTQSLVNATYIESEVCQAMTSYFASLWRSEYARRLDSVLMASAPGAWLSSAVNCRKASDQDILFIAQKPHHAFRRQTFGPATIACMEAMLMAKERILLVTASLTHPGIIDALVDAVRRGLLVKILLERHVDTDDEHVWGLGGHHSQALQTFYQRLIARNCQDYTKLTFAWSVLPLLQSIFPSDVSHTLHARFMVADDVVVAGSTIMDMQSCYHSGEADIVINDHELANLYAHQFDTQLFPHSIDAYRHQAIESEYPNANTKLRLTALAMMQSSIAKIQLLRESLKPKTGDLPKQSVDVLTQLLDGKDGQAGLVHLHQSLIVQNTLEADRLPMDRIEAHVHQFHVACQHAYLSLQPKSTAHSVLGRIVERLYFWLLSFRESVRTVDKLQRDQAKLLKQFGQFKPEPLLNIPLLPVQNNVSDEKESAVSLSRV